MADSTAATPWYQDKPFIAVLTFLGTIAANAVGRKWGVELNVEEIVALATTVLGFVVGYKWKGAKVQVAAISDENKRKLEDIKTKLSQASVIPDETERLQAMANIINEG